MSRKESSRDSARLDFLRGQYDALGWVLTSPRIRGELRDRIHDKAMDIYEQIAALEAPDA